MFLIFTTQLNQILSVFSLFALVTSLKYSLPNTPKWEGSKAGLIMSDNCEFVFKLSLLLT